MTDRPSAPTGQAPHERRAREILTEGAAILAPLLSSHGFQFAVTSQGQGSGGHFAVGRFARDDQHLELHVRWALGIVAYQWDDASISHKDYMRLLNASASYPGYSDDPLDGFRHLLADLQGAGLSFVRGEDRAGFVTLVSLVQSERPPRLP